MTWLPQEAIASLPTDPDHSVAKWAEEHVKVYGARGASYDGSRAPWCIEPLECCDDGFTRIVTFVKPVQAGGSVVGEVAICRWLSCHNGGDVQYNWEDDGKAKDRWIKRVEKILQSVQKLKDIWPEDRSKDKSGLVVYPHCNFTMQGVYTENNVASDSIRFQVNEEIHNWEPGRLAQAYNRTTAYWNSVIANISNAGTEGDQLHQAFLSGTQQHWEVKCPGCGDYHVMRTQFDKQKPELGGLKYDADGCRLDNGDYDYNRLAGTIRYAFPCLHEVFDERVTRRALSLSGRYGEPRNQGAHLQTRSYTLEAVAVDYIPWLKLIQEKHEALKSLKYGDPEPYKRYLQERECKFWNPDHRPILRPIILSKDVVKNRDGLPGRFARYFSLDRQQGSLRAGELPHWWLVIRDVLPTADSLLVWEGKCLTDDDAIGIIKEHGCTMRCGVADSGDDTTHVYQFCLRHGINAIKGGDEETKARLFHHEDGSKRIYSTETPLHKMLPGAAPIYPYQPTAKGWQPHVNEPLFWHYSNLGLLERFTWLRGEQSVVKWDVPNDVSEDYKKHLEAWQLEQRQCAKTRKMVKQWVKVSRRDDLHKCEQYIVMLMEMAGLIGERIK